MLSQTLEADEAYFRFLRMAVDTLLAYMAREREILQQWFQSDSASAIAARSARRVA